MISLTYLSNATRKFEEPELDELLTRWRRHNSALGLSGMLLYADTHFIQTLEGEEGMISAMFDERIRSDTRHRNVTVVLREKVEERKFADWSMGFERLSPEAADEMGFNDYLDPDSDLHEHSDQLGRAGVFHRIFRDNMRVRAPDTLSHADRKLLREPRPAD